MNLGYDIGLYLPTYDKGQYVLLFCTIYFVLYIRIYKDGKYFIIILNNIIRLYFAYFESFFHEPIWMGVACRNVGDLFGAAHIIIATKDRDKISQINSNIVQKYLPLKTVDRTTILNNYN